MFERGKITWWICSADAVLVQNIFSEYAPKVWIRTIEMHQNCKWARDFSPHFQNFSFGAIFSPKWMIKCQIAVLVHFKLFEFVFGAYSKKIFCTKTASSKPIHHLIIPRSNTFFHRKLDPGVVDENDPFNLWEWPIYHPTGIAVDYFEIKCFACIMPVGCVNYRPWPWNPKMFAL